MKKIYILCGIPGAGKSSWVNDEIFRLYNPQDYFNFKNFKDTKVEVCSADSFLYENGIYNWSPQRVKKAHELCREKYNKALNNFVVDYIFVDNTNLNLSDINYYYDKIKCIKTPIDFEIVYIHCKPEIAFKRQTHNIPRNIFDNMVRKFNNGKIELPKDWFVKINHIDNNDYNEQAG